MDDKAFKLIYTGGRSLLSFVSKIDAFIIKNIDMTILLACFDSWLDFSSLEFFK